MDNMFTTEQINFLESIFVRKDDCNVRHAETMSDLTELKIQQAKTNTLLSILVKVSAFEATALGGLLIGSIGKLILK